MKRAPPWAARSVGSSACLGAEPCGCSRSYSSALRFLTCSALRLLFSLVSCRKAAQEATPHVRLSLQQHRSAPGPCEMLGKVRQGKDGYQILHNNR